MSISERLGPVFLSLIEGNPEATSAACRVLSKNQTHAQKVQLWLLYYLALAGVIELAEEVTIVVNLLNNWMFGVAQRC